MSDGSDGLTADTGERYERLGRIAAGGMGEVWRARDNVLGREVAVKVLKREFADDPTFRARFAAEARHAAGLHHPGIATVFDYGLLQDAETPYLVMELVDGKPLSDLLASGTPVDPEQARLLALQTAEALAVAHAAGVVHRDVKPGNLLVTPDGRVKITDFGIARATGSVAFTQTGQIVGTPHYLSPEQARGSSATAASDVYALGVVLFECLAGQRPFQADTPIATALAQIQQDIPPLPGTVPAALAAVVNHSLAKDPVHRYADGRELAEALRGAAPGATPAAAPIGAPVHAPLDDGTRVLGRTAAAPVVAAPSPSVEADPEPDPTPASGSRKALWVAGALALLLVLALLVLRPWAEDSTATDDGTDPSGSADTVRVRKAAFVGDPVDDVENRLEDMDLATRTRPVANDGTHDPGTVSDLSPTGMVETGSTITLQVWGSAPTEEQPTPTETASPEEPGPDDGTEDPGDQDDPPATPDQTQDPAEPGQTATTEADPEADADTTGPGRGRGDPGSGPPSKPPKKKDKG